MNKDEHSGRQRDHPKATESCQGGHSTEPNANRLRLSNWLERWGADLLLMLGAGCISAGAGWIYPPAGLIAAGALLIAGGVLWARGGDEP